MLYVAVYAAMFSWLPASTLAFVTATVVTTLFLLIDAFSGQHFRAPGIVGVSFFACGLAYAVASGFFVLLQFPPPVPPKPPLPFWSGIYYLVSGGLVRDIGNAIAEGIALVFQYVSMIVVCTIISSSVALFTIRRRPHSKWLLLLNTPGILLCGWIVCVILYETFTNM